MSENTKIEWCDHSWSPWRGCTKVSAGCANCYAETLSKRNPSVLGQWGKGKPRVLAKNWNDPVRWNRALHRPLCAECSSEKIANGVCCVDRLPRIRKTVFPSLCDWLDDEVPIEWLARFLKLIHDTPNLTWLLLTKRPENWRSRLEAVWKSDHHDDWPGEGHEGAHTRWLRLWLHNQSQMQPPPNVWVGTSVEDQPNADRRIPALLKIPAVGRFLSMEPLLGPVDLKLPSRSFGFQKHITSDGRAVGMPQGIHWLIIGGESGHGARPCNVDWVRSLIKQGQVSGVATFVKQLGAVVHATNDQGWENISGDEPTPRSWPTNDFEAVEHNPNGFREEYQGAPVRVLLNHPKGGDPAEWPEDVRLREYSEGLQ